MGEVNISTSLQVTLVHRPQMPEIVGKLVPAPRLTGLLGK